MKLTTKISKQKSLLFKINSTHLKPSETVQTFMFSTPSRFVGEYKNDSLLITHAFRGSFEYEMEGPFSRSYYVLSFRVPNFRNDGGMVRKLPNYTAEPFLICLSVLFGKRFDSNGIMQSHGLYRLPDIGVYGPISTYKEGYCNHIPRANIGIPLNLEHFEVISSLMESDTDNDVVSTFFAAGRFYLNALRAADTDPERAYLDLITCGEILSNFNEYSEDELYDSELLQQFDLIEKHLPNGRTIAKNLKKRLYQVKRKFTITLMGLLTPEFFTVNELPAERPYGALASDTVENAIKAAYDIRSAYVHSGRTFGQYIDVPIEMPLGTRVHNDPKMKPFIKSVNLAPTFKGLERIMRFCLLRFLEVNKIITISDIIIDPPVSPEHSSNTGREKKKKNRKIRKNI